jgi:HEAT repeat protein
MKLEEKLEELRRLRDTVNDEALDPILRKSLKDRSNLVVAQAAKTAGSRGRAALVPDLLAAFDRLFENPVKTDAKCWGKTAIVKALTQLEHSESAPFLRAARHIQMEPVMGGQEDFATHLRANAALALVACTDANRSEILRCLVEALADPADTVRIESVRALEQMNGDESCLLLRLKAHTGDPRPAVLGQVFDSLLHLEGERAVSFVAGFMLRYDDEVRDEASLALGSSRLPGAVKTLIEAWKQSDKGEFGSVLLRALSASRDDAALDFLLDLVQNGSTRDHASAMDALQLHKDSPEILERVERAYKLRDQE